MVTLHNDGNSTRTKCHADYGFFARWLKPIERARISSMVGLSGASANFFGSAATGVLVEYCGWRSSFYGYGFAALCWVPMWNYYGWSRPSDHPRISADELEEITAAHTGEAKAQPSLKAVPWKQLLMGKQWKAVWVVVVCNGILWSLAGGIFFAFVPTYMHHQLKFSLSAAGFWSAAPELFSLALTVPCAMWSDGMIERGVANLKAGSPECITLVRKRFTTYPCIVGKHERYSFGFGRPILFVCDILICL